MVYQSKISFHENRSSANVPTRIKNVIHDRETQSLINFLAAATHFDIATAQKFPLSSLLYQTDLAWPGICWQK